MILVHPNFIIFYIQTKMSKLYRKTEGHWRHMHSMNSGEKKRRNRIEKGISASNEINPAFATVSQLDFSLLCV